MTALTDEQIIEIAKSIFGCCDICLSGRGERDREVTVEEYPIGEDAIAFARAILAAACDVPGTLRVQSIPLTDQQREQLTAKGVTHIPGVRASAPPRTTIPTAREYLEQQFPPGAATRDWIDGWDSCRQFALGVQATDGGQRYYCNNTGTVGAACAHCGKDWAEHIGRGSPCPDGVPEVEAPSMTITENGVAKVRAADVLKTAEAREQLAAVARLRTAGVKADAAPERRPLTIKELLSIYDEQKGDWCAIVREVERRHGIGTPGVIVDDGGQQ